MQKEYFLELLDKIEDERKAGFKIYPSESDMFKALLAPAFDEIKVVILGQDPYHGEDQAHGLSFSVPKGIKIPPSLRNIFKELKEDLGFQIPNSGNLESWSNQGVFLLNSILTVRANEAGSHRKLNWEQFTDRLISLLSEKREHIVFILWGSFAQKKSALIDEQKHLILKSAHPSPLSAYRGFMGSKCFSKCNNFLAKNGQEVIRW